MLNDSPAPLQLLAADLRTANYRAGALNTLWGEAAADALLRENSLPARRVLAERSAKQSAGALDTLAALLILGQGVSGEKLDAALPELGCSGAAEIGLIAERDGLWWAHITLIPHEYSDAEGSGAWWIAADFGEMVHGGPLAEDHVVGIGGASRTLAGLILPGPVERALDIGTGGGIQALHLSRIARRVVATDISERALNLAAFTAALNGIKNIEFRQGSLFEPVRGEKFDRIVSNPPFVITPRDADAPAYEYRDGGREGDAIIAEMMGAAPEYLVTGGIAQMLGNWEYHGQIDAFDRIRSWLSPEVDAWIVERERQDPVRYAETWIRDGGTRPGDLEFDRLCGIWLDDFARRDTIGVGFGYVLLRKSDSATAPWRRFERVDTRVAGTGLSGHIAQVLAAHEWHRNLPDERLLLEAVTVSADVTEERHYWPGAEDPSVMILHQGGGFGRSVDLDTGLSALVGASDGDLPLGALIGAIAQLLEVDENALAAELLPRVRDLLDEGFLVPAELAAPKTEA